VIAVPVALGAGFPYGDKMTRPDPHRPDRRRSDADRIELALQAAGLGEFEWDLVRDVLTMSACAGEITGLSVGEQPARGGLTLSEPIHPDDRPDYLARRADNLERGGPYKFEFRFIRPNDGRIVWLRISGVVVRRDGVALCAVGIVQDITALRTEEDQRMALMAELDHRVKNTLAAVQALAWQTAKRTTSLDAFMQAFAGRLKAMGSASELLTAARWRGAAVEHLAAAELGALSPNQTSWDGPELFLTPRGANALSLALHELAANAVKYGALSTDAGHVDVRWRWLTDGGFELKWTETGGPTVGQPARHGFGSTLLQQVTGRELNGEASIEYRPAGVQVTLKAGRAAVAPRPETLPETPTPRPIENQPTAVRPSGLAGARVLIVEDAVLLALELELGLSDAGAQVIGPAYELDEAMALLDQPMDAAVLDANLNGLSIRPVAQALTDRGVPFIFATGYGEVGGAPAEFDVPVIRKPYDVTQVAAAVEALLNRR
jgi:PAS domain S-box-containing protein